MCSTVADERQKADKMLVKSLQTFNNHTVSPVVHTSAIPVVMHYQLSPKGLKVTFHQEPKGDSLTRMCLDQRNVEHMGIRLIT